jgi:hypothetical protein
MPTTGPTYTPHHSHPVYFTPPPNQKHNIRPTTPKTKHVIITAAAASSDCRRGCSPPRRAPNNNDDNKETTVRRSLLSGCTIPGASGRCVLRPSPRPPRPGRQGRRRHRLGGHGLSSSGDGSLVASSLRWSSALLSPWGGEGGGGGEEACRIPGRGEEDEDRCREVVTWWGGQGSTQAGGGGGRQRRWSRPGRGPSVAGDSDGWEPDDRAADAPPVAFRKGGVPPAPRRSSRTRGRQ